MSEPLVPPPPRLEQLLALLDQINEVKKKSYQLEFRSESTNAEYLTVAIENAEAELKNLLQNLQWQQNEYN